MIVELIYTDRMKLKSFEMENNGSQKMPCAMISTAVAPPHE
jgi:hypothetical protein